MEIYGKKYSVRDLRRRVGNMDQIAGVRTVQLDDGNERPTRAAILHTGAGLEVTVLLDRCLDIASASVNGKAMGWRSATGDVAPQYFEAEGVRWLRSYFGGLVTTCGLMNVGAPAPDSAVSGRGLHGRIGNIPAKNLKVTQEWRDEGYLLEVSGDAKVRLARGGDWIRACDWAAGARFTTSLTRRSGCFAATARVRSIGERAPRVRRSRPW